MDNTTGEDWTNVALSLVSGRPISFISQLYEPKYVQRPDGRTAGRQRGAAGGASGADRHGEQDGAGRMAEGTRQGGCATAAAVLRPMMRDDGSARRACRVAPSSIAADARTRELGELSNTASPSR